MTLPTARRSRLALVLLVAAGIVGGWYAVDRGKSANGQSKDEPHEPKPNPEVSVETVAPQPGGLDRICVQPGTIEPYESADLYAKVSGFLVEQTVDIGSRVKKGDVLARIGVPEYEKQVKRDKARVRAAEAKVRQMEAHLAAAEAESKAAEASVTLAKVLVRAKSAYRQYREKQLARYRELAAKQAIEPRAVDEQEDFYLSAQESENEAKESVNAATERAASAKAKITQAQADVEEVKAEVGVAAAELERSQVFLDYSVITSPYTGVITRRSFRVGDFIKSADQGAVTPVLSIERTDLMMIVVQVPDRDVPYVSLGDPAEFRIDALPGRTFETHGVSRWSKFEDQATRTMRVEVDVPNPGDSKDPDGILAHGMYGQVTLNLQKGSPTAVRVPTSALTARLPGGKGTVRVLRGDRIQTVPVALGTDNGVEVEVLAGLTAHDQVVVRASGPVEDGAAVTVVGAKHDSPDH